jgi:hypothetical protein
VLRLRGLSGYPRSWIFDRDEPAIFRDALLKDYQTLGEKSRQAGISCCPIVRDKPENPKIHSRQYPSPYHHAEADLAIPHIIVQRKVPRSGPIVGNQVEVTSSRELVRVDGKTVPLAQVTAFEQQGWEVWNHPESPINPITSGDPRKVERTEDVFETDRPYMDSNRFLEEDNEMLLGDEPSTKWRPGQLLGANGSSREARASSLSFSSFVPAAQMTDLRSATSGGHALKFLRPPRVGAGWGDYDTFDNWQSYGRQLKPEMVERNGWNKDPLKPLVFDGEDGAVTKTFSQDVAAKYVDPDAEPPQALWERFPQNRNRDKYRRSQASRPSRGGGQG